MLSKTKKHFVLFNSKSSFKWHPQITPMLSQNTLESFSNPISADEPSGPDLAYDPAFSELETLATPKAEQQFGDTIMASEEPNWALVAEKAEALLSRTKDFRIASTLTRALTNQHGIQGFVQGMQLLVNFTENFWDSLHPQLDSDDDNDPTMRVNALAPLSDYRMLPKDFHEAKVGSRTEVGQLKAIDIETHYAKGFSSVEAPTYSIVQVQAALLELLESDTDTIAATETALSLVKQLQSGINDKVGSQSSIDLVELQTAAFALYQAVQTIKGTAAESASEEGDTSSAASASPSAAGGPLKSRDDAVRLLSQIITYLEKTEPGNPAPLLIKRAQRLIGMNFLDIINDLAPDALSSVQNIAGRSEES
jgi:type VI secretion system protein ImpA